MSIDRRATNSVLSRVFAGRAPSWLAKMSFNSSHFAASNVGDARRSTDAASVHAAELQKLDHMGRVIYPTMPYVSEHFDVAQWGLKVGRSLPSTPAPHFKVRSSSS